MKISSIERVFTEELQALYGPEEAGSITWLVIEFVCKINRTQYLSRHEDDLGDRELAEFYNILAELKKMKPVQYVLGETEFYGYTFKVNPSVLIPRPETEELVDWILKDVKMLSSSNNILRIIDIGTGSGCIPIILKKYLSNAVVSALDISEAALTTARSNAALNHSEVQFIQDDILHSNLPRDQDYDVIVSNPPYITLSEKKQMHANVLEHEPHTALFVPDSNPLFFYNAIADFALDNLKVEGALYLEINENLGAQTISLLQGKGFSKVELRQDLRDRDRMIKAQLH